jgi:hypothetical protein
MLDRLAALRVSGARSGEHAALTEPLHDCPHPHLRQRCEQQRHQRQTGEHAERHVDPALVAKTGEHRRHGETADGVHEDAGRGHEAGARAVQAAGAQDRREPA